MKFTKFSAFSIHLALSILIFSSLVAIMYFYWFPGDLFFMDGGWEGIKLVAMVDLVLGPLLTLLLFKPGKPKLALDMSLIAGLQIAALAYGFYTTSQQRIVALVYSDGQFNTVTYMENRDADAILSERQEQPVDLASFSQLAPINVYTRPFNGDTYPDYFMGVLDGLPEQRERSDEYLALTEFHSELRQHRLTNEKLEAQYSIETIQKLLQKAGYSLQDDIELYPLRARFESGIAVFDTQKLRIVDILHGKKLELAKQQQQQNKKDTLQAETSDEL